MNDRALLSNDRGLTLPEILIAIAILGIGLGALMAVVPIAAFGVQDGNQTTTATFLAQQRLEQVRGALWTATTDCVGVSATATSAPAPSPSGTCSGTSVTFADEPAVSGFTQYGRTVRVTSCGVAPGCDAVTHAAMRRVTVTVTYRPVTATGVSTTNTSVTLEWLVAQRL
jgi:prepilin-type N-terminal cleavage/methylation domain-containing protein